MDRCKVCNDELPSYAGVGRPAMHCKECRDMGLREGDHRKPTRTPWRGRYVGTVPDSASLITEDQTPTARAWREVRARRLETVAEYDRKLLARKRELGVIT